MKKISFLICFLIFSLEVSPVLAVDYVGGYPTWGGSYNKFPPPTPAPVKPSNPNTRPQGEFQKEPSRPAWEEMGVPQPWGNSDPYSLEPAWVRDLKRNASVSTLPDGSKQYNLPNGRSYVERPDGSFGLPGDNAYKNSRDEYKPNYEPDSYYMGRIPRYTGYSDYDRWMDSPDSRIRYTPGMENLEPPTQSYGNEPLKPGEFRVHEPSIPPVFNLPEPPVPVDFDTQSRTGIVPEYLVNRLKSICVDPNPHVDFESIDGLAAHLGFSNSRSPAFKDNPYFEVKFWNEKHQPYNLNIVTRKGEPSLWVTQDEFARATSRAGDAAVNATVGMQHGPERDRVFSDVYFKTLYDYCAQNKYKGKTPLDDPNRYERQKEKYDKDKAAYDQAKAQSDNAKQQYERDKANYEQAKAQYDQQKASYDRDKAAYDKAKSDFDRQMQEYEQNKKDAVDKIPPGAKRMGDDDPEWALVVGDSIHGMFVYPLPPEVPRPTDMSQGADSPGTTIADGKKWIQWTDPVSKNKKYFPLDKVPPQYLPKDDPRHDPTKAAEYDKPSKDQKTRPDDICAEDEQCKKIDAMMRCPGWEDVMGDITKAVKKALNDGKPIPKAPKPEKPQVPKMDGKKGVDLPVPSDSTPPAEQKNLDSAPDLKIEEDKTGGIDLTGADPTDSIKHDSDDYMPLPGKESGGEKPQAKTSEAPVPKQDPVQMPEPAPRPETSGDKDEPKPDGKVTPPPRPELPFPEKEGKNG